MSQIQYIIQIVHNNKLRNCQFLWPTIRSITWKSPGTTDNFASFEISNWMHLFVGQVDCKNHFSQCTMHLSEIYKAGATNVKIRNKQSSIGIYSSQTIGRVKFRTLSWTHLAWIRWRHFAGNGLAPNRWQVITRTNDASAHWSSWLLVIRWKVITRSNDEPVHWCI